MNFWVEVWECKDSDNRSIIVCDLDDTWSNPFILLLKEVL